MEVIKMKKVEIKQVDSFTSIPFGGNPAGVVLDAASLNDDEKLKIAREMNLSNFCAFGSFDLTINLNKLPSSINFLLMF